ncbi:hypothetical protein SAMN03159341_11398 [Paenibacillus sp. 1_12]|uniref:hypothetical protein n=1 Tax=Paenibacillus sp. 1_12 TaxID=1566278 RepID=UPI0008F19102|nr:hypothetical protein [Paenibacillus sp. 1_12]SFL98872.1 hypothetical protein SAMN03159341_11398 [Paenibacillus sp. 1_12]
MTTTWIKSTVPILIAAVILSACTSAQQGQQAKSTEINSTPAPLHAHNEKANTDSNIIPSYDGPKVKTTNQHGSTFSGMGTSVYSRIGSSSLLANGVSSQIETMLNDAGISGIKVLVLGDLVVLGEAEPHTDGASYEPLQSKLLSSHTGSSGKGLQSSRGTGPIQIQGTKDNGLGRAQSEIQSIFGGNIRVLTVNNTDDLSTMDRVKATLNSGSSVNKLDKDISTIIQHAAEQNVK